MTRRRRARRQRARRRRRHAAEQLAALRETCAAIAPLVREGEVVVTHGNGPQVGNELLRQERAADEVPPLPLYLAVAQTQAEIGALIETRAAPRAVERRSRACSRTCTSTADDQAFDAADEADRAVLLEEQAQALERERGWQLVEDAGRGYRRVVPSPQPLEIVELDVDPTRCSERARSPSRAEAAASRSSAATAT